MQTKTARSLGTKFLAAIASEIVCGEIVGKIRRGEDSTDKIAIVVVPEPGHVPIQWGVLKADAPLTRLDQRLLQLRSDGKIVVDPVKKNTDPVIGPRFRKYIFRQMNIGLELTIVPQSQYGYTVAYNTGDAKFWATVTASQAKGGLMPEGWRFKNWGLYNATLDSVSCPTEQDFFRSLGIEVVPQPANRNVNTARDLCKQIRKDRGIVEQAQGSGSVYTIDAEVDAGGKGRVGGSAIRTSWEDD